MAKQYKLNEKQLHKMISEAISEIADSNGYYEILNYLHDISGSEEGERIINGLYGDSAIEELKNKFPGVRPNSLEAAIGVFEKEAGRYNKYIAESKLQNIIRKAITEALRFQRTTDKDNPKKNVGPADENLNFFVTVGKGTSRTIVGDKGFKTREAAERKAAALRKQGKTNVSIISKKVVAEAKKGYKSEFDNEYWGVNDMKNGAKFKTAMRSKKIANSGKPIGNWQASSDDAHNDVMSYKADRAKRRFSAGLEESNLNKIVAENVKKALKESSDDNFMCAYGVVQNALIEICENCACTPDEAVSLIQQVFNTFEAADLVDD